MVRAKKNIIDIMREGEVVAMPYDRLTDTTIPVSVRSREAYEGYKRAVSMAKELGALQCG